MYSIWPGTLLISGSLRLAFSLVLMPGHIVVPGELRPAGIAGRRGVRDVALLGVLLVVNPVMTVNVPLVGHSFAAMLICLTFYALLVDLVVSTLESVSSVYVNLRQGILLKVPFN